jgi:hypothetical protein
MSRHEWAHLQGLEQSADEPRDGDLVSIAAGLGDAPGGDAVAAGVNDLAVSATDPPSGSSDTNTFF